MLILFLLASWSIGVVMNTSPSAGETEIETVAEGADLGPLLGLFLVIGTVAVFMRGRTPAFVLVVFSLPLIMLLTYLIFAVGFNWSLFLILLVVVISAIAIWKGSQDEGMSPFVASMIVIGVSLLAVTLFGGGGKIIFEALTGSGKAPSIDWDDPGGYTGRGIGGLGTFVLILLIGGILTFLVVQKVIPIIRRDKEEDEKEVGDQISSTVDKAVTDLREGKDVHSTILRCYQRMCSILEEKGAKNFEFMTPREFENQAVRTLDVPTSKVSEIREVFELAKYSNYRLGEEERDKAVKALKELRKELG
ncbi:MAG: DUF4129 domain-containing protein [Candidatus Thermoplasmatota archaeon]